MSNQVILVDENDLEIGTMEKLDAHKHGLLHRAFSIFIFNDEGEMLLQQRAMGKYHSEGLWSNTCCSHPSPGEDTSQSAHKRLFEEMGMKVDLHEVFQFVYKAKINEELSEHEFDHVFFGTTNNHPVLNSLEAMDYKWVAIEQLKKEIAKNPDNFSAWFRIILQEHFEHFLVF